MSAVKSVGSDPHHFHGNLVMVFRVEADQNSAFKVTRKDLAQLVNNSF
jgi:hypothetical protein